MARTRISETYDFAGRGEPKDSRRDSARSRTQTAPDNPGTATIVYIILTKSTPPASSKILFINHFYVSQPLYEAVFPLCC